MNVERLIVLVMAMIINVVNNMRTRSECRGRLIVLVMAMIINVVNNMRTRSECRE